MSENDHQRAFEPFEFASAVLLGLAAIGTAVCGLQGGQWGGRQLDAFSMANTLTTKAATQYNEDTVLMNADYAAVAVAKQHLLEARDAKAEVDRERHLDMASYFYTTQLSTTAYHAMELPAQYYVEDEDDAAAAGQSKAAPGAKPSPVPSPKPTAAPQASAAPDAAREEHARESDSPPEAALERDIPNEALVASLPHELDDDYVTEMLAEGKKMFADADKKFEEGRQANENGDKFELAVVFYTVALFFAGIGLVIKSSVRWGLFVIGTLVLLTSTAYVATLPWAS